MQQRTTLFRPVTREAGQSIVLIAVMMIALLGFVGLAVDLGLVWVRRAQLVAAVDAAALAGVTELESAGGENAARVKVEQFLNSNAIPAPVISTTLTARDVSVIGATEYTVTSTWPVELFFMRLLGFEVFEVEHGATAAYFPLVDIYASRRVELGVLNTSNQAVFGPNCVVVNGDPFSPLSSNLRPANHYVNPAYSNQYFSYRYRILIPPDYESTTGTNVVRVELFDPDTWNYSPGNTDTTNYVITQSVVYAGNNTTTINKQCPTAQDRSWYEGCVIVTDEPMDMNPFWFIRIDEMRTGNNSSCGAPGGNYPSVAGSSTGFHLYYFGRNTSGGIERKPIAAYTSRADNAHDTDMRWVTPGDTDLAYDQTVQVPSQYGTFAVNLSSISDIVLDQTTGNRFLFLDVTAISGASENGYEIWAGPPTYNGARDTTPGLFGCGLPDQSPPAGVPSKANQRNLHVANCGRLSHSSQGVTVFAMGNLPMNSNTTNPVDVPLIYVGPEYGGSQILVSLFDSDSGALSPIVFYLDTLAYNLLSPAPASPANPVNTTTTDWYRAFGVNNNEDNDSDLAPNETRNCRPGNCSSVWIQPAYRIQIPINDPTRCVNMLTTPQWCTPFYGGRLTARYIGGSHDTYGWQIRLPGLPYLVK
ncbi:MAG: hypothetical protein KA314_01265 [Chloroflexi bacterium]|nr:hypothetical protein [Chloroflexota bacterium]MBP8054436.1 hypothetical protein [Chloroflexota bacterium]